MSAITGSEANLILGCNYTTDATDLKGNVASTTGTVTYSDDGALFGASSKLSYGDFLGSLTSLSASVKLSNVSNIGTGVGIIFSQYQSGNANSSFFILYNGGTQKVSVRMFQNASTTVTRETSSTISNNDYVSFVYSGSTRLDIYVNGVKDNGTLTGSIIANTANSTNPFTVGGSADGAFYFNTGQFKYLEVYSDSKSDSEMLDLYITRSTDTPNAPENVNAYTTVGVDGSIFVSWTAPSTGSTPDTYNLYYSTSTPVTTGDTKISGLVIGDSPKIITGLSPSIPIYVAMSSVNASGESDLSTEDSATPTGTAPDVPVITTVSQTKVFNNYGNINISGTCDSTEQLIKLQIDSEDISNAVYVPASQGTFNALSVPIVSGEQVITAKACSIDLCSSASDSITITGVDRAVTQEDGNIESKIYNGLKTILTDNVDIGVSTIIYEGQERIMPCIEIDLIEEELNEKFSCFELINVSFVVRAMTKDNYNFVSGQFDDSDISGTRNGNAHFINKVREEIMKDFSTEIPELIDLQYQSLTKIELDDEISGYELTFTGLYNRPRVN